MFPHRKRSNKKSYYTPFITDDQVQSGINKGTHLLGTMRVASRDAYVTSNSPIDIFIEGMKHRNRSFNGDTVVVEILPRKNWKVLSDTSDDVDPSTTEQWRHLQCSRDQAGNRLQPSGRVVNITKRNSLSIFVGRLRSVNNNLNITKSDKMVMFLPDDMKQPKIFIPINSVPQNIIENPKQLEKKLVSCKLVKWNENSCFPLGLFQDIIGDRHNLGHEVRAVLTAYQIPDSFKSEVIKCLPLVSKNTPWDIPQTEIAKREDFRKKRIFTIDPASARDLDDALHCTLLKNGNFEVGVHIADVTHFVKPKTALDREAQKRATTTYMVHRAFPMLPNILCEDLCSLHPNVDRLAFSVVWELTPEGEIKSEHFSRSVIRSCSKMSYQVAQHMIEKKIIKKFEDGMSEDKIKDIPMLGPFDKHKVKNISQDVKNLWTIAQKLRRKRFANGAMNISSSKLSFKLDNNDKPVSAMLYVTQEANHMIEEFMLLANMRVGAKIVKEFPSSALLRQHNPPVERSMKRLVDFANSQGLSIDGTNSQTFSSSLSHIRETSEPHIFAAIQDLSIRPMQLAKYFCSGELDNWHHFGLNIGIYTHFTSPIRRYTDIIVHRQLAAALNKENLEDDIQQIAEHCNTKKLNSRKAQDESVSLFLCLMVQEKPRVTDAVVVELGDRFMKVLLPQYATSTKIFFEDVDNLNGYIYNDFGSGTEIVVGQNASVVLQWCLTYDINDPMLKKKAKKAVIEDDYEELEDKLKNHMRRNKRHGIQKANKGIKKSEQSTRDLERDARGDSKKNRDAPSELPSLEQKFVIFSKVCVRLTMRQDRIRPTLGAQLLHPQHPEIGLVEKTMSTIEVDSAMKY